MKTRLLRKLRREAKRRIKITNPLKEQYNIYYIEKYTRKKNGYVEKEWFHYPMYGCFLNTRFGFRDRETAIELLATARRDYILLEIYKLKAKQSRNKLLKEKLKERRYLNKL